MEADKLKQWIAIIFSTLSALYLALKASGFSAEFINPEKLDAWSNLATSLIPLVIALYGVYINTYVITKKAKKQEEVLKQKGLK